MKAIAYLRVSGKSQVEGDGFPRQQAAIEKVATQQGFTIFQVFREEGVSGTTEWGDRPAFVEMVGAVLDNPHIRTVFVENLTRLAREYTVQEAILVFLAAKGVNLISADTGENITEAVRNDPMKKALIQIQGVFSELEKSNLVRKLRAARERKKLETGRCEGQLPYGAKPGEDGTLRTMLELRHRELTIREIVEALNAVEAPTGYSTRNGRPWTVGVVARILARHLQDTDEPEFS